jgi:hypothetical protein
MAKPLPKRIMPGDFDERGIAIDARHSIHLDGKPLVTVEEGHPKNPALALYIAHQGEGFALNPKVSAPKIRTIATVRKTRKKWFWIPRTVVHKETSEAVSTPEREYEAIPHTKRDADTQYIAHNRILANEPSAIFKNCFLMLGKAGTADEMTSAINNFLATPDGRNAGPVVGILHHGPQGRVFYPFNAGDITVKRGDSVLYSPEIREQRLKEEQERRAWVPRPRDAVFGSKGVEELSTLRKKIRYASELIEKTSRDFKTVEKRLKKMHTKEGYPVPPFTVFRADETIRMAKEDIGKIDPGGAVSNAIGEIIRGRKSGVYNPQASVHLLADFMEQKGVGEHIKNLDAMHERVGKVANALSELKKIKPHKRFTFKVTDEGRVVIEDSGKKVAGVELGENITGAKLAHNEHNDIVDMDRGPPICVLHQHGFATIGRDGRIDSTGKHGGTPIALITKSGLNLYVVTGGKRIRARHAKPPQ